jgi:hypothetical protein
LAPFSLSSFLGVGLGKQTRKPLGARQKDIKDSMIVVKENTVVPVFLFWFFNPFF